jgi:crossover junction endodeoxyribonuclease RuvC
MRFVGIDPSTQTGFVVLDEYKKVHVAKVITGISDDDLRQMVTMVDELRAHLRKEDYVAIEGFPYKSPQAIQLGGIGYMIRALLFRSGVKFVEIAPNTLKKRVGVTGFIGEKGSKERLKGKAKKDAVIAGAELTFGRSYSNDNINDAFILAHIAREKYLKGK